MTQVATTYPLIWIYHHVLINFYIHISLNNHLSDISLTCSALKGNSMATSISIFKKSDVTFIIVVQALDRGLSLKPWYYYSKAFIDI